MRVCVEEGLRQEDDNKMNKMNSEWVMVHEYVMVDCYGDCSSSFYCLDDGTKWNVGMRFTLYIDNDYHYNHPFYIHIHIPTYQMFHATTTATTTTPTPTTCSAPSLRQCLHQLLQHHRVNVVDIVDNCVLHVYHRLANPNASSSMEVQTERGKEQNHGNVMLNPPTQRPAKRMALHANDDDDGHDNMEAMDLDDAVVDSAVMTTASVSECSSLDSSNDAWPRSSNTKKRMVAEEERNTESHKEDDGDSGEDNEGSRRRRIRMVVGGGEGES